MNLAKMVYNDKLLSLFAESYTNGNPVDDLEIEFSSMVELMSQKDLFKECSPQLKVMMKESALHQLHKNWSKFGNQTEEAEEFCRILVKGAFISCKRRVEKNGDSN